MSHQLPELGYSYDALEPHIDARTMEIHHSKHHNAYVSKLNDAISGHAALESKTIEALIGDLGAVPEEIRGGVRNNGGGHANHSLFWKVIAPGGSAEPGGALAAAINRDLGGLESLKEKFATAAATRFGSGWAWICSDASGKLSICSTPNQDSPLMGDAAGTCGNTPILGLDVWEHAYYLNYQNRRPDYISAFWNVVNWDAVAANYAAAQG